MQQFNQRGVPATAITIVREPVSQSKAAAGASGCSDKVMAELAHLKSADKPATDLPVAMNAFCTQHFELKKKIKVDEAVIKQTCAEARQVFEDEPIGKRYDPAVTPSLAKGFCSVMRKFFVGLVRAQDSSGNKGLSWGMTKSV